MAIKSKRENGKSRMLSTRIPIPDHDYLIKKAQANPDNAHNHLATELNDLIAADHAAFKKSGKHSFAKK